MLLLYISSHRTLKRYLVKGLRLTKFSHFAYYEVFFLLFIFKDYLFIHERHKEGQKHRQREKQAPCGELDEGLNLGTLGSRPEPKMDAQPLSHPGAS